jgi:hypothetical protein
MSLRTSNSGRVSFPLTRAILSDRSFGDRVSTQSPYSVLRPLNSGHLAPMYCSAASRTTQATDTFFPLAISANVPYISRGKLIEALTLAPLRIPARLLPLTGMQFPFHP